MKVDWRSCSGEEVKISGEEVKEEVGGEGERGRLRLGFVLVGAVLVVGRSRGETCM